jgi:hypothetical protein
MLVAHLQQARIRKIDPPPAVSKYLRTDFVKVLREAVLTEEHAFRHPFKEALYRQPPRLLEQEDGFGNARFGGEPWAA